MAGSGVIGINGAAAHLVNISGVVIIIVYGWFAADEATTFAPTIVHVDTDNSVVAVMADAADELQAGLQMARRGGRQHLDPVINALLAHLVTEHLDVCGP